MDRSLILFLFFLLVELHLEIVRNLTIEEGNVSNITAEIFVGTVFRGCTAIFTEE